MLLDSELMTADSSVQLISFLAGKHPEAILGTPESAWVDFKGVSPEGPYNLGTEKGKFELAKDVAAFANAGGGLIVCGFKATRRPAELHEVAVKSTPFARKLVNVTAYKDVITEYVRPLVKVNYYWHDHPDDDPAATGSYFVIEVAALPEADRWALVTRGLNEDGKLIKGSWAVPIRNGDTTTYLSPDDAYRLLNDGLRGERQIDVDLAVADGAVWDLRIPESQFEQLLEVRRRGLLSALPQARSSAPGPTVPSGLGEQPALDKARESAARLQFALAEFVESAGTGSVLFKDTRSPEQYVAEVDAYIEACREQVPSALFAAEARRCRPLRLQLENDSAVMLRQVEVIARLSPAHTAKLTTASDDLLEDHAGTAWPTAPVPYGKKTYLSSLSSTAVPPMAPRLSGMLGVMHMHRQVPKRPEIRASAEALIIRFPAVDVRPYSGVSLDPITVYGRSLTGDSAVVRWTATCTNLDGRTEGDLSVSVQHADVPLSVE